MNYSVFTSLQALYIILSILQYISDQFKIYTSTEILRNYTMFLYFYYAGIQPGSALCKGNLLFAALSLWPISLFWLALFLISDKHSISLQLFTYICVLIASIYQSLFLCFQLITFSLILLLFCECFLNLAYQSLIRCLMSILFSQSLGFLFQTYFSLSKNFLFNVVPFAYF